eukprot:scaffold121_cov412-Prasinococcus_capsulatus_cf.AAC.20
MHASSRIVYNALKDDGSAVAVVASSTHLQLAYALRRKLPHLAYIALLLQPLCPSKYYPPCFVDVKALPPPASFKDSPALVRLSMQALQQAMLNLLLALMPESTNLKLHNDVWLAVTAQLGDQNRKVCAAFGLEQEAKSVEDRAKLAVKRFRNEEEGYRTLYAISKHFFKRPPTDLPSSVTDAVTGSLFLKQVEDHLEVDERSDKLKEFLSNAEEPPIYIGFGSMSISKPAQVVRTLLGALQLARKRAVILRGWAELSTECIDAQQDMALLEYAAKHVLFADSVPHDWIMPRCSINVIHGGVGTTSAAVRAGKPLIVMPFAFDQAFMADRVVEHGIAYRAPSVAKCSAKKLASLIKKVSGNKKMYERAAKLAELVRQEDGPGKAVEMVQIEIEKTQRAAAVSGEAEAEP